MAKKFSMRRDTNIGLDAISLGATDAASLESVQHDRLRTYSAFSLNIKRLPKILTHYRIFSYVMFAICLAMLISYLIYVLTILFTSLFNIQYDPVIQLLGYNSYNLQCPFIGIIFCMIFAYHAKYKVKLEEGNFFGMIGLMLLFSMVMVYDGVGVWHLYRDRMKYIANNTGRRLHVETFNENETNPLAWQYTWSTNPTCAKIYAKSVKRRLENERIEHEAKEESHGPAIINDDEKKNKEVNPWMFPKSRSSGGGGSARAISNDPVQQTFVNLCDSKPYAVARKPSAPWMKEMQKKFKCCGPRGYNDWEKYVSDIVKTCGPKRAPRYKRGCAVPFNEYLAARLHTTACVMFTLANVFLLMIFTACLHFAAMKYEDKGIVQTHSLLDLTEPENIQVLDSKSTKPPISSALLNSDQVRGIFQSSQVRHQHLRNSEMALKDQRHTIHSNQIKSVSKTLMAFNKATNPSSKEKEDIAKAAHLFGQRRKSMKIKDV